MILLPLEVTLASHNVIILIQAVLDKNQNLYQDNIFLEEGLYQSPKNNDNKCAFV